MGSRGPQSFKKRQKEQQRKEKRQEKLTKRLERKNQPASTEPDIAELPLGPEAGESLANQPE